MTKVHTTIIPLLLLGLPLTHRPPESRTPKKMGFMHIRSQGCIALLMVPEQTDANNNEKSLFPPT
jgi:hypothetical protein